MTFLEIQLFFETRVSPEPHLILRLFLIFVDFEPGGSYKNNSYKM